MLNSMVTHAKFRPATLLESQNAKGHAPYRIGSFMWDTLWKITGTVDMYLKGEDTRTWGSPYLQNYADRFWAWNGYHESEFLKTRYSLTGKRYTIENEKKVCAALLSHHRNDEIFSNNILTSSLLEMVRETSPEEKIGLNDLILGCDPENTKTYRTLLHKSLNQKNIDQFNHKLKGIVADTLYTWSSSQNPIDVTQETSLYAARNFTLLLFGKELASEKLSNLVAFINTFVIKRGMGTLTKYEEAEFKQNLKQLGETIASIAEENLPLFEGSEFTLAQKKAMIFTLLFAGQETTSALLSYILWKLALNPELQEELYRQLEAESSEKCADKIPVIKKLFTYAMKEFNPAYGIPRLFKVDACLEYTLEGEETPRTRLFFKGETISVRVDKIAMLSGTDLKTDSVSKWFGFGYGPHYCPGDKLAVAEISELVTQLIKGYRINTSQASIETAGQVTLRFLNPVHINLVPRLEYMEASINEA